MLMLKYILITFLLLANCIFLNAQIALTNNSTSRIGSNYYYSVLNGADINDTFYLHHFSFSISGTNNIWDFTNLPIKYGETINIISPSKAPDNKLIKGAKYVVYDSLSEEYAYYGSDSSGLYWLSSYASWLYPDYYTCMYAFAPPLRTMKYPFTLGSKTLSKTKTVLPVHPDMHGVPGDSSYTIHYTELSSQVLASGNIVLPSGTYPAILEYVKSCSFDTIMYKGFASNGQWQMAKAGLPCRGIDTAGIVNSFGEFNWYIESSSYQVAYLIASTDSNGKTIPDEIIFLMNSTPTLGINNITTDENNISIYPNPANNKLFFQNNRNNKLSYTISDVLGRILLKNLDIQNNEIDISSLSQGLYFISFRGEDNSIKTLKFLKK